MKGQKLLVVALVGGLLLGSLGGAEAKKKKKKKLVKTPVTFYLRAESCSADTFALSIKDGEDDGPCSTDQDGFANEVAHAAGEEYSSRVWVASDGVPFKIDAAEAITGEFHITSSQGVSAGPATLDIVLTGESEGMVLYDEISAEEPGEEGEGATEIGSTTVEYDVDPTIETQTVTFEIVIDEALHKLKFTSLELTTTARGEAPFQGAFELDDPASFLVLPTLVKSRL